MTFFYFPNYLVKVEVVADIDGEMLLMTIPFPLELINEPNFNLYQEVLSYVQIEIEIKEKSKQKGGDADGNQNASNSESEDQTRTQTQPEENS